METPHDLLSELGVLVPSPLVVSVRLPWWYVRELQDRPRVPPLSMSILALWVREVVAIRPVVPSRGSVLDLRKCHLNWLDHVVVPLSIWWHGWLATP